MQKAMRIIRWTAPWLLIYLWAGSVMAQQRVPLPVRKVVLYKNGMGYFEHLGAVRGRQSVEISLPRSQLNDVLKSLTVIDLGGGSITSVTYDSSAPLERRLAELPIDLRAAKTLVGFLNQVRGAAVKVETPGGAIEGRLMGAEPRERRESGSTVEVVEASILTASGELRLVELESVGAIRFTDPSFAADLVRYLDLLSSRHDRDVRKLRIQTAGEGERQLYVSYTSESPIWKTTYRIILDPEEKPLLQGWAIVDNTTPLDWENVALSLVAGAPVSFVQNLSQPIYARRPVVPLPEGVQVSPQTHEGTLNLPTGEMGITGTVRDAKGNALPGVRIEVLNLQGERMGLALSGVDGRYRASVVPGTYSVQAGLGGYSAANYDRVQVQSGRLTALNFNLQPVDRDAGVAGNEFRSKPERGVRRMDMAASSPMEEAESFEMLDEVGQMIRRQAPALAEAQALGEQFEYKLSQPISIRRNESGLLPIIHSEVEGEKVSLYNAGTDESRPRLAVWLKNTSGLTLDAGAFTVIDSNAFAGEGLVETIQPEERRILSYAVDLAIEVSSNTSTEQRRVDRVEISRGILRMERKLTEKRGYIVRNNDKKARTVVIEHPVRRGWNLIDTPAPAESTSGYYRFRLQAEPKSTTELTVREETPREMTYSITNVTPEQIALWIRQRAIDAEIEQALSSIVGTKTEINDLRQRIAALEREQSEIFRDQERVRGNLQRLGRSPEEASLRQRYIGQLEDQEDRLAAIRAEREKLEGRRVSAQRRLDEMLQNLTFKREM